MVAATPTIETPPAACPRCSGRVVTRRDSDGLAFVCLVCGFNPPTAADVRRLAAIRREEIMPEGRQRRRAPSHKNRKL